LIRVPRLPDCVSREEFLAGTVGWFAYLDKKDDGGITLADFAI